MEASGRCRRPTLMTLGGSRPIRSHGCLAANQEAHLALSLSHVAWVAADGRNVSMSLSLDHTLIYCLENSTGTLAMVQR